MSPERLEPNSPLTALLGIGPARARGLAAAACRTAGDLLWHLPFRYEDRRRRAKVGDLDGEGSYFLVGRLGELRRLRSRRRGLTIVRGWLEDGSGRLPVVWFNRPYLLEQVTEGREYLLYGAVRQRGSRLELVNPTCERSAEARCCGRIVPIYRSLGGLGPATIRRLLDQILDRMELQDLPERLPESLLERYGLPPLGEALAMLHRPAAETDLAQLNERRTAAHARLIYGEFLELQVELALVRRLETRRTKVHKYRIDERTRGVLRELLPFRLTSAQQRVLQEIVDDLERPYPMLRLLQGDVGSGKTIVAALTLVLAIESGLQAAFMAPTELLAEQHFRTLARLLGKRYRLALLTGSAVDSDRVRAELADGGIQLAVGTHALIQETVEFSKLGLAVVDEQHRFGVAQRRLLQGKGNRPDMLVMTATPIPRSLALTVYGDLALSVIDELPPGRKPVTTKVVGLGSRRQVYAWLRQQLEAGAQAYVVFPLIEESERVAAESIASMGERVREALGRHRCAVLHGRIPPEEREAMMESFASGEVRVLIATTVIEVGVDVPRATVMIIESAERFGLAQLHQLRGRVGRGRVKSYCIALHGRLGAEAVRRLEVFAASNDGFRIADADLEIRGPGDLLGTRQAGVPLFRVADVVADREWLERARRDAQELVRGGRPLAVAEPLVAAVRRRAQSRYERFAGG